MFRSGSNAGRTIRRSSDATARTATTTLADDDQLTFAVAANEVWWAEAYLLVNAANGTMDCKLGWSGPAGASAQWGGLGTGNAAQSGWGSQTTGAAPGALRTLAQGLEFGTSAGTVGVSIGGMFVVGATAGTIALQWSQVTSDAGELKLLANSVLRITKLA